MRRLVGFFTLAVIVSSTSGCAWLRGPDGYLRDRSSDYLQAQQTALMKLPSNIQVGKRLVPLLPIPGSVLDENINGEFQVPRPPPLATATAVGDYALKRNGDTRWVAAQRVPSEVWPVAIQFFQDNGFRVDEQRPQTGELTTTWQRADELSASIARHIGVSGLSADREIRLCIRIEPGVQRNTSEIYVVSANRRADSIANVDYGQTSVNTELDAALVDEMLTSMSRSVEKRGSDSLLAASDFGAFARASLSEDGSGNPILSLSEDLDRAWFGVGRALEQGDWRIEDINRTLGLYYIDLAEKAEKNDEKPGFLSNLFGSISAKQVIETRAQRYQVRLSKIGNSVQVTVEENIDKVAPPEVSNKVLGIIQDNMGCPGSPRRSRQR